MSAAGRVEDDDVMSAKLRRLDSPPGDLYRRLSGDDRKRGHLRLLAKLSQLFLRGGPTRVERSHQHLLALALTHAPGNLGRGGGLAGALQADHHDHDRSRRIEVDGDPFIAKHGDKLVMDDLD